MEQALSCSQALGRSLGRGSCPCLGLGMGFLTSHLASTCTPYPPQRLGVCTAQQP